MATVSELLAEAVASPEVSLPTPAPTVAAITATPVGQAPAPVFGPAMPPGPRDPNAIGAQEQYNLAAARLQGLTQALATPEQRALANDPSDILSRRNDFEGRLAATSRVAAERAALVDMAQQRTWAELTGDSVSNAGQAFVSGFGSLAALGVSTINNRAGAALSQGVESFDEWMGRNRSDAGQARARLAAGRNAVRAEANDRQHDRDIADGASPFMAGLYRLGRGLVDGVASSLEDPATAADMTAQGVGSLFGGGAISKTLTAIGRTILPATVASTRVARAATGMSASIGLQEGAGAYQDVVVQVLRTPYSELEKNSPRYNELIASGSTPEAARIAVANEAGRMAAAIQAPAAAVTARVTGAAGFEAAPLRVRDGLSGVARNLIRESVEEGIQGATGQAAQNLGIQQVADQTQDLTAGVGEAAGSGAVAGLLTAGALQGPGAAARATGTVAGRGVAALAEVVADRRRGEPVATSTAAPEPVPPTTAAPTEGSPEAPATSAPAATAAPAPTVIVDEPLEQEVAVPSAPTLARVSLTEELPPEAGTTTPLEAPVEASRIAPTAEAETLSPDRPSESPEKVVASKDEARIGAMLKQEEDGNLSLTDEQRSALRTSHAVLKADREAAEKLKASGIPLTGSQEVSTQILSNQGEKQKLPSAQDHVRGISESFRAQDYDGARALMERMRNFVQHMNNKVEAVNAHFANGHPKLREAFKAFDGRGKWFDSGNVIGVNPRSEKSLAVVQRMQIEAQHLATVYNGLVDAYPTLAAEKIEPSSLVPELQGDIKRIVLRTTDPAAFEASQGDAVAEAEVRARPKARVEPSNDEKAAREAALEAVERNEADRRTIEADKSGKDRPKAEPKTEEAKPQPQGIAAVFPKLLGFTGGKVRDFFSRAYKLSPEQKTRYAGEDSPLSYVRETLGSLERWVSNVGDQQSTRVIPEVMEAYQALFNRIPVVRARMEKNLQAFVSKKRQSGEDAGKTTMDRLLEGTWINGMVEGKALNITEVQPDGSVRYNDALLESSILAGLNWLINLSSGYNQIDQQEAEAMLGREVDEKEVLALNSGIHSSTLVRSLAQRLTDYWGVSRNDDAETGLTQGIAEAVAIEIITAFTQIPVKKSEGVWQDQGNAMLNLTKGTFQAMVNGEMVPREYDLYTRGINFEDGINMFPNAIELASLVEPQGVHYYEGEVPPTPNTQLHNPGVKLSAREKLMTERASKVVYRPNMAMANFYQALTRNGFLELFGNGDLEGKILNDLDRASMEGQNRSLSSAYDSFTNQMLEMGSIAAGAGKSIAEVTLRYAFGVTRVGRLQMLGAQNPQSTKAIREVFLSTWATLNMSTTAHQELFALGLGQALGVKIHQKRRSTVQSDVRKLLADLDPVVQFLGSIDGAIDMDPEQIQMIKDTFAKADGGKGIPVTPLAIHALTEQAKLNAATDLTKFETSLYVEADGVTNGVVNAMMLFSSGAFDRTWIETMGKGGLLFRSLIRTMNEQHTSAGGDHVDIYTAVRDALDRSTQHRWSNSSPGAKEQFDSLKEFMGLLLPDVTIDAQTGAVTFGRGITKNPVTITLYGSGANGIAGKMVKLLEEQIAAKKSLEAEATARGLKGEAFNAFVWAKESKGDQAIANEYALGFAEQLQRLTSTYARTNIETGGLSIAKVRYNVLKPLGKDPKTFELTPERKKALRSNMRYLFVDPMRESISEVVGPTLLRNADTLRKATQVQSIFLESMFQELVKEKLAEKRATDPEFMASHFLTQKELNDIVAQLRQVSPDIIGTDQSFFLAGTTSSEMVGTEFARGMNEGFRTPGTAFGPQDIGVGGVPVLNIAYGDGRMIQLFMTYPGSVDGVLPIYDGINMPLTSLEELSTRANRAVWESWKGNPILDANDSFQVFLQHINEERIGDDIIKKLRYALFGFADRNNDSITNDILFEEMQALGKEMQRIGNSVRARGLVTDQVKAYVDQMASAGASYETSGTISLDVDVDDAVRILNRKLDEITATLEEKKPVPKIEVAYSTPIEMRSPSQPVEAPLGTLGKKLANGARKITPKNVAKLFQTRTNIPGEQRDVLREIFRGADLEGYSIVYGTAEQLNDYQALVGDEITPFVTENGVTHGVTSTGSKTIYLFSPTAETFTHEMVHAATFMKLQAMLDGTIDNEVSREVLANLRALSEQFRNMEDVFLSMGNEAHKKYVAAIAAMMRAPNEAIRLNEFMAWTLANQDLAAGLRATPATKTWIQSAIDVVKQMIFGRKRLTAPEENMFSQLLFTSSVIMRTQPTVAEQAKQATLFMSTVFGTDVRLNQTQDLFDSLFLKFANAPRSNAGKRIRKNAIDVAVFKAQNLARIAINNGFNMNMQEKSLFQNIVSAFATSMQITPASVVEIEANYRHVMSKLTVEDFMTDPSSLDPRVRTEAQKKYDVISGTAGVMRDSRNRSTLMPVFLGLAVVNPEFRAILAKMEPLKAERDNAGTMDAHLNNLANSGLEKLSTHLSGTKGDNVQQVIDALVENIHETTQDKLSFIQTFVGPVGQGIDWMNEKVVYGITKLSETVIDATNGALASTTNPYAQMLLKTTRLVAKLATEKRSAEVSLGLMHAMNQGDSLRPLREFMGDLVGRTRENAKVYDLIKTVKTAVSQIRQQFREHLPKTINDMFTRPLTEEEQTIIYRAFGKSDLAALLMSMNEAEVLRLIESDRSIAAEIGKLETDLRNLDPAHFSLVQAKAKQLANYMMGGSAGQVLLRNAESIARLNMMQKGKNRPAVTRGYVEAVDALTTLYAFQNLSKNEKDGLRKLLNEQNAAMSFSLSYLKGQRVEETSKAQGRARFNALKGYISTQNQEAASLMVADEIEAKRLISMGYEKVADYAGSRLDPNRDPKAYYYAPVSGRAAFNQGIYQNVRETSGGVDVGTGFTYHGMTAGVIADPREVADINRAIARGVPSGEIETLIPIIGDLGVAIAYERSVDPQHLSLNKPSTNFAEMLGVWRGRQAEEFVAQMYNEQLNHALYDMWKNATSAEKATQFVNILDVKDDAVVRDAVSLMTYSTRKHAESLFGKDTIMVRRDMLNDALGYRKASIGDAWTGVSRMRPSTAKVIQDISTAVMGKKAYVYAVNAERIIQNVVRDAKVLIVVKSVIVPAANFATNILQMVSRGVPLMDIYKGVPRKLAEIDSYTKSSLRKIDLEAQLRAANPFDARKLENEIQSINDAHRRLSIWPLIQAGEFSSISDAGVSQEDTLLTEGRWGEYFEQLVTRLPKGVQTAGRYAIITRDTSLFQGLQKSVAYGDFIFKAILYDNLTQKKGKLPTQALAQITEEFVHYDRLPGRTRGYLEDMGLLWFYNYKIRFSKVALSIVRRNPVQALFAAMLPIPLFLGSVVDLPTDGALFTKAYDGKLDYSIGPAQGIGAIGLHPLVNMLN